MSLVSPKGRSPPGPAVKRSRIQRKTPLRRRNGRQFPRRHDKAYWDWLGERVRIGWPCDGCGYYWSLFRSHLKPRSRGGDDRNNACLLCFDCDRRQEKRTEAFCAEIGVDLWAKAWAHTDRFLAEAA